MFPDWSAVVIILIGISGLNSERQAQNKQLCGSGPVSTEALPMCCGSQHKLTVIIKITVYPPAGKLHNA